MKHLVRKLFMDFEKEEQWLNEPWITTPAVIREIFLQRRR
jgi:hypothetical protein